MHTHPLSLDKVQLLIIITQLQESVNALFAYCANLAGLILTPGPIVEATTQDLMY